MLPRARQPVFDDDDVARAEAALRALGASFQDWIADEVAKVHAAREDAQRAGWSHEGLTALYEAAHDAKGLGATYDYPFVTRLAASLCRLIETPEGKAAACAAPALIHAHVDAMRAAVRDRVRTDEPPAARALIEALEARVRALGVAPR
ncbi:MAG: Hpt domain-containing protein [Hydrogenophilaceae bacterium]|jgi:hypothetical protein|nr:Hpt domain-containing protein [Hydrogenophilaceae bacterium]